ncbi:putative photosynthetic complex assembly protein PuhE [Qipengyuania sp.]|uniref:putative photosynthetic complex assembly protein PuhE n=1 Tax=Qipengyuania sp. TaxID=2004515 RepID=UPI003AF56FFD
MVSWSGHILPVIATIAMWFLATGLIAWLDNRERATFPRSLVCAGLAGVSGLVIVAISMGSATIAGVYWAFAGAILIWAWHEIGFLTGAITGPRREPCPEGASGWQRFSHASAAMAWHEIALAVTAVLLVSLSWNAPNQVAAMVFALLFVLRLSTKLAIFAGVPNMSTEIMPQHLGYLKSYFGSRRFSAMLGVAILFSFALAIWLGGVASAAKPATAEAVGGSLLFALAALGALEHLFLALPLRDGALWGWALRSRTRETLGS